MFDLEYQKGWFSQRQRLYAELARAKDLCSKTDSVFFRMGAPDVGLIDCDIFVNGKKQYFAMFTETFDPFPNIHEWLEAIVKGQSPIQSLLIQTEGPQMFWVYEMLRASEEGYVPANESFATREMDTPRNPEIGIFYIYESYNDKLYAKAIVNTRDFVTAFYLALLDLAANGYNRTKSDFHEHWFGLMHRTKRNNWTFYNSIKSSLIEWYIHSNQDKSCYPLRFRKMPQVRETVQMWCDFGGALFWGRGNDAHGACIGDVDSFDTHTCGTIELSSIDGLQAWYDEWNKISLDSIIEEKNESVSDEWFERGRQLALKVRELLPDTIDLFYYDWYPAIDVQKDDEYQFPERLPMIIPNPHALRIKK